MKKIIYMLLLFIMFISFVKAEDYTNIKRVWKVEDNNYYRGTYYTDMYYIKYSERYLKSVHRYSGETKKIGIAGGYQLFRNNHVLIIKSEGKDAYSTIYDPKLDVVKKNKIGSFEIDYCNYFESDKLLVSGQYEDNKGYHRNVVFLDLEGNLLYEDEILTVNSTKAVMGKNIQLLFADSSYNTYYLENYKIVPKNLNLDNSYAILVGKKIYNYSSSGQIIKSLDIPEGRSPRIAKKGDYYYVATGLYTNKDNTHVYVSLNIYLINENLEIESNTFIPNSNKECNGTGDYDLDESCHGIVNSLGNIYAYYGGSLGSAYSVKIYENLEFDEAVKENHKYSSCNKKFYLYEPENNKINYYAKYPEIASKLIDEGYISITHTQSGNKYVGSFYVTEDDDNYIVNVTSYKKVDDPGGDINKYQNYTQVHLIYYDKDLNEIFNNQVYDWTLSSIGCGGANIHNFNLLFEDYIVFSANNNQNNLLQIYDKEGNLLREFPDDFVYNDLSINNLFIDNRGFFVEFDMGNFGCIGKGASFDGEVLSENKEEESGIQTVMAYYSYPFLVNTKTKGEGKVIASYEYAMEGTLIRFEVEPKEGYVLGEVKITDADGNIIKFYDYSFTMPSADVLIEVTFVKATVNPNTKAFITYLVIVVGIASGIITYLLFQKKSYLS